MRNLYDGVVLTRGECHGNSVLNDDVIWCEMVMKIIEKECSAPLIAKQISVGLSVIFDVL